MKNEIKREIKNNLFAILTLISVLILCVSILKEDDTNANDNDEAPLIEYHVIQPIPVEENTIEMSRSIAIDEDINLLQEDIIEETTEEIKEDETYFGYTLEDFEFLKCIDNEESDIDDDQIQFILDECNDKGINPYLVASIIYTESRGKSDVYNKENCRGYGGISEVAGEFIYENILNQGEYSHNMAFDPYTNLSIIINLLDYLMTESEGDIKYVIQYYSGTKGEEWYINYTIENLHEFGGPTLQEIKTQWINRYNQRLNIMEENNND